MKAKKLITIIAVIALILSMTGCVSVNLGWGSGVVVGTGEIITETYTVGDFTQLTVRIYAKLHLTNDDTDEVRIEMYENLAEYIYVENNDGHLSIDNGGWNLRTGIYSDKTPQVYLSVKTLEKLNISGAAEISGTAVITAETFTIQLSGACSGNLNVDVEELNVDISGAGDLTLVGTAEKASVNSSGAGNINAFKLITKQADVNISGVGAVEIYCEEKLNASLSGIGSISYKGNPDVTKDKSGLGSINKAD